MRHVRLLTLLLGLGMGMTSAWAVDSVPGQLGYDEVAAFGAAGTVWCFEPHKNTCSFITHAIDPVKGNPRYYVMEKWDADSVLTVLSGGVLRGDGTICERGTEFVDTSVVTDPEGTRLGELRQDQVRQELHEIWAGYEDVEYCYAYSAAESGHADQFVQHQFVDGEATGSDLIFEINHAPDAIEVYSLRPPNEE